MTDKRVEEAGARTCSSGTMPLIAIGDVTGGPVCMPGNPNDTTIENPSFFAIDASTGQVLWDADNAQSFGATTYAGGFLFTGLVFSNSAQVRDAVTGCGGHPGVAQPVLGWDRHLGRHGGHGGGHVRFGDAGRGHRLRADPWWRELRLRAPTGLTPPRPRPC